MSNLNECYFSIFYDRWHALVNRKGHFLISIELLYCLKILCSYLSISVATSDDGTRFSYLWIKTQHLVSLWL